MTTELTASWLFVPGSRPDRFAKAVASGAHQVILDLEDAVASTEKENARNAVVDWLSTKGSAWVRINSSGTTWHDADLQALTDLRGLRGLVVPKAESLDEMMRIARLVPAPGRIIALVETASGVANASALAASPVVNGLALGSVDFCLDIDAEDVDDATMYARSALVVAARAAGLRGPVDSVTLEICDPEQLMHDAQKARRLGFAGKLCIHPAQVSAVNSAFAPSSLAVDWAEKVIGNAPRDPDGELLEAAFDLDGRMIDKPLLERARRILTRANRSR